MAFKTHGFNSNHSGPVKFIMSSVFRCAILLFSSVQTIVSYIPLTGFSGTSGTSSGGGE